MKNLIIEASTERGIIALSDGDTIVRQEELPYGYQNAKHLIPITEKILGEDKPDGIIVGVGPGSYTGIRIGAITAKTLSFVWNIPIYPVSTLEAFVPNAPGPYASIIDAKVSGVYLWKGSGEPIVCPLDQLGNELSGIKILVTPSSSVLKPKLDQLYPNSGWIWEEHAPSAKKMVECAHDQMPVSHVELQLKYLRSP